MNTKLTTIACLAISGSLLAQGTGTVNSSNSQDSGAKYRISNDVAPEDAFDPNSYVPVPMPKYRESKSIEGALSRPVYYDVATGRETIDNSPGGPKKASDWVKGWAAQSGTEPEAWGNLTTISSKSFPWGAQCRVFFSKGGGNFVCSGTLVDARTVITAGHCVHEGNGGAWATNVRVAPGWDGDDDEYSTARGISLASWTNWTQSGSFDGDIGWIRLDRPVGSFMGWFGYGYNTSNSFYTGNTFNMAGYPGNSGCWPSAPHRLHYGSGRYDSVTSRILRANTPWTCTIGGMSGTGNYYIDNGNRFVHSVVSWERTNFTDMGHCRMIQAYFDYMQQTFIPGAYGNSLDLFPMDMNTSSSVAAGSNLGTTNYFVVNNSLANPASATYNVSVYLSTNDFISTGDTLLQTHTFNWNFGAKSSVRVNISGPRIPSDTPPGNYYVGVLVTSSDANAGNNNHEGWDCAPVTVTNTAHTLRVRSRNPSSGVSIGVSKADRNGNQNGSTSFDRSYWGDTALTLTAPSSSSEGPFYRWVLNNVPQRTGDRTLSFTLNTTETAEAQYYRYTRGSYTQFGLGCSRTGYRIPSLNGGRTTPDVGGTLSQVITGAPAFSPGALYLGFSRTLWGRTRLPLLLTFIGMNNCYLDVSPDDGINFSTDRSGNATLNLPIPNDSSLVGLHLYSQAAVLDSRAPWATKVVHSRAIDTAIGGNRL